MYSNFWIVQVKSISMTVMIIFIFKVTLFSNALKLSEDFSIFTKIRAQKCKQRDRRGAFSGV